MRKKTLYLLFTLLVVLAVLWVAFKFGLFVETPEMSKKTAVTPPADLKVNEYSVTGQILEIKDKEFSFNAGLVFTNTKGETSFDYIRKTVLLTPETKISKAGESSSDMELTSLKQGAEIIVYTADNPFDLQTITAKRIEVK